MSCALRIFLLSPSLALAACGGSGGGAVTPEDISASVAGVIADLGQVGGAAPTLPESGAAVFNGYASAFVKETITDQTGRQLVGPAELTADFATGTVTGRLGDMLGATGVNQTELFAAIQNGHTGTIERVLADYDQTTGEIRLSEGRIEGDRFTARIAGTITHDGVRLRFGGHGDGSFSGDGASGAQFTGLTENGMTLTEDGAARAGRLAVVAAQ